MVGSGPDVTFPAQTLQTAQTLQMVQNSMRLVELLGALLAPRWPQMRSGPPVELHLEASWSLCWRQDGPSVAKMSQVGIELAVKFGKLRTKRRILYIHKLPMHRKAATML